MTVSAFDPTRAPAGRLARLGVVLDVKLPTERVVSLARLCERAGIEAVWITDPDAWVLAETVAPVLERTHLGLTVDVGGSARDVATQAATFSDRTSTPVELSVRNGDGAAGYVVALRAALGHAGQKPPRLSAVAEGTAAIPPLLAAVDDLVLPGWRFGDLDSAADEARVMASEAGRDPSSLGVAVLVPVSIGRTGAEASARADRDPTFRQIGHPAKIGIFGTLEECQDRVIALAHAGVTDLRCIVPGAPDVHDVIAQLTAMTIGTTDLLRPGSLRSPAPPPPEGWGGRPERPPEPRVSGGSKRR